MITATRSAGAWIRYLSRGASQKVCPSSEPGCPLCHLTSGNASRCIRHSPASLLHSSVAGVSARRPIAASTCLNAANRRQLPRQGDFANRRQRRSLGRQIRWVDQSMQQFVGRFYSAADCRVRRAGRLWVAAGCVSGNRARPNSLWRSGPVAYYCLNMTNAVHVERIQTNCFAIIMLHRSGVRKESRRVQT